MPLCNNKRDYFFHLYNKERNGDALDNEEKEFLNIWSPFFISPRKHEYGKRAKFHDYKSPARYHIILKRADNYHSPFSDVAGDLHVERNVQYFRGKRMNQYRRVCFNPEIKKLPVSHNYNEDMPRIFLRPVGVEIYSTIRELDKKEEFAIYALAVMPDHVHILINVKKWLENDLGYYIQGVKKKVKNKIGENLFAEGFADVIIMDEGQLAKAVDYINDNPRRYLIKRRFPDLYQRVNKLKAIWAPRFLIEGYNADYFKKAPGNKDKENIEGKLLSFTAVGNPLLLKKIDMGAVRVSSKFSEEERDRRYHEWREVIEKRGVLVSPFISGKEKDIRDVMIEAGGNVIVLSDKYQGERYKPAARYFELCKEGRYLEISCYEACREARRYCREHKRICGKRDPECRRHEGGLCRCDTLVMNEIAEEIAAGDFFERLG